MPTPLHLDGVGEEVKRSLGGKGDQPALSRQLILQLFELLSPFAAFFSAMLIFLHPLLKQAADDPHKCLGKGPGREVLGELIFQQIEQGFFLRHLLGQAHQQALP
jgi:hypothetical protein